MAPESGNPFGGLTACCSPADAKPKDQWASPRDAPPIQRRNFLFAQLEGIGISLANAASPFLAVFLARLGASDEIQAWGRRSLDALQSTC